MTQDYDAQELQDIQRQLSANSEIGLEDFQELYYRKNYLESLRADWQDLFGDDQ